MTIAIHQPNFLPWTAYFNKIKSVDTFVFFDDIQFERGKTYTSRTKILLNGKEHWLTIPVKNKSDLILIKDITVDNNIFWKKKHLKTISLNYKKAEYFDQVFPIIKKIYSIDSNYLIDYNIQFIISISEYLDLHTKFILSSEIKTNNINTLDKILNILVALNATSYISGSGAGSQRYINQQKFLNKKIKLIWQNYLPKPYKQLNVHRFIPNLSIIDLIFNCGKNSIKYF